MNENEIKNIFSDFVLNKKGEGAFLGEFDEGASYLAKKDEKTGIPGHKDFFENVENSLREIRGMCFGYGVISGFELTLDTSSNRAVLHKGFGVDGLGNMMKLENDMNIPGLFLSNFTNKGYKGYLKIFAAHKKEALPKSYQYGLIERGYVEYKDSIDIKFFYITFNSINAENFYLSGEDAHFVQIAEIFLDNTVASVSNRSWTRNRLASINQLSSDNYIWRNNPGFVEGEIRAFMVKPANGDWIALDNTTYNSDTEIYSRISKFISKYSLQDNAFFSMKTQSVLVKCPHFLRGISSGDALHAGAFQEDAGRSLYGTSAPFIFDNSGMNPSYAFSKHRETGGFNQTFYDGSDHKISYPVQTTVLNSHLCWGEEHTTGSFLTFDENGNSTLKELREHDEVEFRPKNTRVHYCVYIPKGI